MVEQQKERKERKNKVSFEEDHDIEEESEFF